MFPLPSPFPSYRTNKPKKKEKARGINLSSSAPSWSWASITGPIVNHALELPTQFDSTLLTHHHREWGATIGGSLLFTPTDIEVFSDIDNEFGLVNGGFLKGIGRLQQARRRKKNLLAVWPRGCHEVENERDQYGGWGWWDDEDSYDEPRFYSLHIAEYARKSEGNFVDYACLFLVKVKPEEEGRFRRYGRGRMRAFYVEGCEHDPFTMI